MPTTNSLFLLSTWRYLRPGLTQQVITYATNERVIHDVDVYEEFTIVV